MAGPFPSDGMKLTNILVVEDLDRVVAFYRDVPGADLTREYGGSAAASARDRQVPTRDPGLDARCLRGRR